MFWVKSKTNIAYHWEGNDEKSVKFSLGSPQLNIYRFLLEFRKFHKSYNNNLRGIRKQSVGVFTIYDLRSNAFAENCMLGKNPDRWFSYGFWLGLG